MKKVLFTLALAAFAVAANAQFVLGGQIQYTTNGYNNHYVGVVGPATTDVNTPGDQWANQNTSTLTILPKIGYNLNDKMQIGLAFGLTWDKTVDYSGYLAQYAAIENFEGWERSTQTGIQIAPYFRYNITEFKGFTLFCEAQLGLTFGLNPSGREYHSAYTLAGVTVDELDRDIREGREDTYTNIALTIVPGLNYKFNDSFSADLYIDLLGIGFTHRSEKTFRDWNVINNVAAGAPANTDENVYTSNRFYLLANANAQTLNNHFGAIRVGFNYHF